MNCQNCKNWVFGKCSVTNLIIGPGLLCNAWELSQSHEMVTMPFATFASDALQKSIDELEARITEAIAILENEMGKLVAVAPPYLPDHYLQLKQDHYLQLKQAMDILEGKESEE